MILGQKVKILVVMLLLFLFSASNSYARTIHYTGIERIIAKVTPLSITEIQFIGAEVASIIMGFPVESVSIQNAGNLLYVQPLVADISGDIFVVLKNGKSVAITLVTVPEAMRDRSVRIVYGAEHLTDRVEKIRHAGLTFAGLIRIMILAEDVDGVAVSKPADHNVLKLPFPAKIHKVYDAVFMRGYVMDVPPGNFDLRDLSSQGLVAGAVRDGKLYLVFYGGQ